MRTKPTPAQNRFTRQQYILGLAVAVSKGRSIATASSEESEAARAVLKRAGIRLPSEGEAPGIKAEGKREDVRVRPRERVESEEALFVKSVGIARAIYRLTAEGDPDSGKRLVVPDVDLLPKWFTNMIERTGGIADTEPPEIPGTTTISKELHRGARRLLKK